MDMPKTLYVANRDEWRAWLQANHASASEVWLIFYKAHTGQPSIAYEDSVEEALCFGWVDSLIQRIDEERYARKFTPRKLDSVWSPTNKRRVVKVIREGRMTPAGLAKITYSLDEPIGDRPRPPLALPPHVEQVLRADAQAWENFNKLPPSHKRNYIGWITDAVKEETQLRRAREAVERLRQGLKLGMK
jgi:uncharacterized protein YdeI (YjbR/CyaY-like superfamily)